MANGSIKTGKDDWYQNFLAAGKEPPVESEDSEEDGWYQRFLAAGNMRRQGSLLGDFSEMAAMTAVAAATDCSGHGRGHDHDHDHDDHDHDGHDHHDSGSNNSGCNMDFDRD